MSYHGVMYLVITPPLQSLGPATLGKLSLNVDCPDPLEVFAPDATGRAFLPPPPLTGQTVPELN